MDPLDVLENRISLLEQRIFGNDRKEEKSKPLAESVTTINNELTTALSQRDSINAIMKRLNQLEDYLDPMYGDKASLTPAAKLELVLIAEPQLRETLANLEWLSKAQTALNSEPILAAAELTPKLEKLTLLYLDFKEQTDAQTDQVQQLLKQYNDIVTSLSAAFVQYDQIVTEAEVAAIPKKRLD